MFVKIQKMLRNRKGFTLVELIVVIAILGILSAIAIPRLAGISGNARQNADNSNLDLIQNAVSIYEAEHGTPPQNSTEMNNCINTYLNGEAPEVQSNSTDEFYMDKTTGKVAIKASAGTDDIEVKITP